MARYASRHGRYDAKGDNHNAPAVDTDQNTSLHLDLHTKGSTGNNPHHMHGSPWQHGHHGDTQDKTSYQQDNLRRNRQNSLTLDDSGSCPRPWSSGSDEGYIPSPPPHPPSSARHSERSRPLTSRGSHKSTMDDDLPDVSVMRPASSLNKFRPLPSISQPSGATHSATLQLNDLHLDLQEQKVKRSHDLTSNAKQSSMNKDETQARRYSPQSSPASPPFSPTEHPLPPEPSEHEPRLLLAVKLPVSGKRYQRHFSPEDYLQDLHHFAENMAGSSLANHTLACNAPRTVFCNLTQRICDVGLLDKTVLYFEERADS